MGGKEGSSSYFFLLPSSIIPLRLPFPPPPPPPPSQGKRERRFFSSSPFFSLCSAGFMVSFWVAPSSLHLVLHRSRLVLLPLDIDVVKLDITHTYPEERRRCSLSSAPVFAGV